MAVSKENGIEAYELHDTPVNSKTFCDLLKKIDENYGSNWHGFADSG
jgi:hypothetical protein